MVISLFALNAIAGLGAATVAVSIVGMIVVVSFLIGIGRSWELLGGPQIGLTSEMRAVLRARGRGE